MLESDGATTQLGVDVQHVPLHHMLAVFLVLAFLAREGKVGCVNANAAQHLNSNDDRGLLHDTRNHVRYEAKCGMVLSDNIRKQCDTGTSLAQWWQGGLSVLTFQCRSEPSANQVQFINKPLNRAPLHQTLHFQPNVNMMR
jgi:hypothetical protein